MEELNDKELVNVFGGAADDSWDGLAPPTDDGNYFDGNNCGNCSGGGSGGGGSGGGGSGRYWPPTSFWPPFGW